MVWVVPAERAGIVMSDAATSHPAEIKTLRQAYAALNRGDVPGFLECLDPRIERVEQFGFPTDATYRGLDAVRAHVEAGRGTWAEGACEPQRFLVSGDKVVVFAHVRVRVKNETQWREGDTFDVFTFRGGMITEFHSYLDQGRALAWAGVKAGVSGV